MNGNVLIVEDEEAIINVLSSILIANEYIPVVAKNGGQALTMLRSFQPDVVLLDLGLPDMDGIDILKKVKEVHPCPVLVVSARDKEWEKVEALDLGADDYITKPFSLRELKARIKAVLRRTKSGSVKGSADEILTFGTLEIDLGRREVKQQGKIVDLTPSEYAILITLCQNIGRPYSRLQLLNATLGESYAGYERAIDTHVSNLRKKIEPNPQKPVYILTVYGLGYKFGDHYETNQ